MATTSTDELATRRHSRRWWLRRLLYGALSGMTAYGFTVGPRWLRTRRLRFGDAPVARFAYFTDLHFKGDAALLDKVLERIHAWQPDFALFGGDLVEEASFLEAVLGRLSAMSVPLFGVPGNHDYWSGVDFSRVDDAFRATGGRWLLDEVVEPPGGKILLAGYACQGTGVASKLLPANRGRRRAMALVHYPMWVERLAEPYDAVFAGHSHGGQVRLPGVGALLTPAGVGPYELGRFQTPAGPLYVSSGVGTFFLNVRFRCPPEVVLAEV
ncbi:MAG: metallophosphoesterase [Verrucomicrobiales bacterium]|nr:metallophosphoesterase [Verrucomicrobiales bacterium]